MLKASLHLVLVLALVWFAGCGNGEDEKSGVQVKTDNPPANPPVEPAAGTPPEPATDTAAESREIANKLVDMMGIEAQIPSMKDALSEQARTELDLTDAQCTRLAEILDKELTGGLRPLMVKLCTDYFTLEELKDLRDERESPELNERLKGFLQVVTKESHAWGYDVGQRAAKTLLEEADK